MGQTIELREIPRGKLVESLEGAARKLRPDPGPNHKGPCDMFRGKNGFPVCRGTCKAKPACHMVIIGIEGSHSDLYNYLALCTCMSNAELDKLLHGRAHVVEIV